MSASDRPKISFAARGKWEDLKKAILETCAASGLHLRITDDADELVVERVIDGWTPKELRLEYDPLRPRILWKCCDPHERKGEILFHTVDDSVFYVVDGINRTVSDIVVVLCNCVTGKI